MKNPVLEKILESVDNYKIVFPNVSSKKAFYWNITSAICIGSLAFSYVTSAEIFGAMAFYKYYSCYQKNIFDSSDMKIPKFKKNIDKDTTNIHGKYGW